jgi:hypothetical protein
MSHFSDILRGPRLFFTPKLSLAALRTIYNLGVKKSLGPLKISLEMAHKVIVLQKKIMSAVS